MNGTFIRFLLMNGTFIRGRFGEEGVQPRLGWVGAGHELPAEAGSMSLTCQVVPLPVKVTA
jgi:hypothetical protein